MGFLGVAGKRAALILPLFGLAAALLAGCGGSGGISSGGITRDPCAPNTAHTPGNAYWTILVYMNAANNLQPYSIQNMNQMESVGSVPGKLNIVVQWKMANCYDCGNPQWTGVRRYYVTHDLDGYNADVNLCSTNTNTIHSTLLRSTPTNTDMGSWQTLHDFIVWGMQNYPADHYALIIWDHGSGWRNINRSVPQPMAGSRAVSFDDQTGDEIETWELPEAMAVTPKLDAVMFDASLEQMIEVAYEIRNSASVMIGSEESPPGTGYPYDTILSDLLNQINANNGTDTPCQLGSDTVKDMISEYGNNSNVTQSTLKLSAMDQVASALNQFSISLLSHINDQAAVIMNARNNAQAYEYPDNKDLYDYANQIATTTSASDLRAAAIAMEQAVTASVLSEAHGSQSPGSRGLAVYVPSAQNYLSTYTNLALTRVTRWAQFLQDQTQ